MVLLVCLGKGGVSMMLCVLLAPLLFCTVRAASTGGCGPVPIVPHATALSDDTSLRSKVRYNCMEGYAHTGQKTKNTCRRTGWTNNVICSPDVGCDNPNQNAAQRTYIQGLPTIQGLKYPVDTVGNVDCTPGFVRTGGDRTTTCYSAGSDYKWTDYQTECSPRLCGDPGRPYKGGRDSNENTMGAQVRFHCNIGYNLVGDSIRTCLADGTWTNHVPTCELTRCGHLQNPTHGSVRIDGNNYYGDTVTVTCDKGYSIIEPEVTSSVTITCTSDGTWSPALPTCSEVPCAPQSLPLGQVKASGYAYADLIEYKCDELTTTQGETSGQCLNNGQWNIPPPKCLAHCKEYRLENGINHYKRLSDLRHIPHGSKLPLSCHTGYQLSPLCWDTSVSCDNGTWTGCTDSTCQPEPCTYTVGPGVMSPAHGGEIPSGTNVTFICRYGYEGGGRATCSLGVLTKGKPCTKKKKVPTATLR